MDPYVTFNHDPSFTFFHNPYDLFFDEFHSCGWGYTPAMSTSFDPERSTMPSLSNLAGEYMSNSSDYYENQTVLDNPPDVTGTFCYEELSSHYGNAYGDSQPPYSHAYPACENNFINTSNEEDGYNDFGTLQPPPTHRGKRRATRKTKRTAEGSDAEGEVGKPVSKLEIRRQALAQKWGPDMLNREGNLKGNIITSADGSIRFYDVGQKDEANGGWIPADYHDNWREEFIQMDNVNLPYTNPPAAGEDPLDITSNCDYLGQHLWRFDTPQERSQIVDKQGNHVFDLQTKPDNPWPSDDELGAYLYHRGLLMLDQSNQPVFHLRGLPLCFSSKVEGGRMEALKRVMPWVHAGDIKARMPREIKKNGIRQPIYGLSTLRHRQSRFRDDYKLPCFDDRKGSKYKSAICGKRKR